MTADGARGRPRPRPRTPSCSGRCTAAAATSASRRRSSSRSTRSARRTAGLLLWPGDAAPEIARASTTTSRRTAPDELGSALGHLDRPPEPFVPSTFAARPCVGSSGWTRRRRRRERPRPAVARPVTRDRPRRPDALRGLQRHARRPTGQPELLDGRLPRRLPRRRARRVREVRVRPPVAPHPAAPASVGWRGRRGSPRGRRR